MRLTVSSGLGIELDAPQKHIPVTSLSGSPPHGAIAPGFAKDKQTQGRKGLHEVSRLRRWLLNPAKPTRAWLGSGPLSLLPEPCCLVLGKVPRKQEDRRPRAGLSDVTSHLPRSRVCLWLSLPEALSKPKEGTS